MSGISETVDIVNARGLHARASAKFVTLVAECTGGATGGGSVSVSVEREGQRVNGTSIMGLMMLGAARGSTITIHVDGPQEAAAPVLARLAGLVRDGFGED